jgi:hypothetical protein
MQFSLSLLPLAALIVGIVAAPLPDDNVSAVSSLLDKRADAQCGSQYYSATATNAASQKACSYYNAGTTVGSNSYPHTFNNNEGFDFAVSGPYLEFPILSSGSLYAGGMYIVMGIRQRMFGNVLVGLTDTNV